jgi:hypothetical protein
MVKQSHMKKLLLILTAIFCFASIIFFGCTKINEFDTPATSNFAAEARAWFTTSFVNTAEYKQGTSNGEIKVANWNYGKVYKIGNMDVAEFPLSANKKKVYITEKLSDADARRVVDATNFKVLFVKSPSKGIEVRIIEFIPTFEYLKAKNFNINDISFKDYQKEFKGDFLMFDYRNELLKGYRFTNKSFKTLSFNNQVVQSEIAKVSNGRGNVSTESTQNLCDNLPEPNPNCSYDIVTIYEIECNGHWTPEEGYNPLYCTLNVISINCYEKECNNNGGDDPLGDCIAAGGTPEGCLCSVYGIGCGGGNGGGGTGGGSQPTGCQLLTAEEVQAALDGAMRSQDNTLGEATSDPESLPDENGIIIKNITDKGSRYGYDVLGTGSVWVSANYTGVLKKLSTNAPWKFKEFSFVSVTRKGGTLPACFTMSDITANITTNISSDGKRAEGTGGFEVTILGECAGYQVLNKTYEETLSTDFFYAHDQRYHQ